MENCNPAIAPTSGPKPLGPDPHSKDIQLQDKWSNTSVVGMMMYLASNSRLEITFAVHQCARFSHGTKHSHGKAILQISWYHKGMQSEGLVIKPNMKEMLHFNCFADADFARLFSVEDSQD
eukprot:3188438-Ditylum_brightwellii.AAC.1